MCSSAVHNLDIRKLFASRTLDPEIMPCVEHLKVCVQVLFITQTKGNCMSRVGLTLDPEIAMCGAS